MKKRFLIYALILIGILMVLIIMPNKKIVQTRKEILKEQKQENLEKELIEAKKNLKETIIKNKKLIKEREKKEEKDRKQLKKIEEEILSESVEKIRREKLDDFLGEIDRYKYLPEDSIRTLENLKEKLTDKEVREIDKRLYKLYESMDEFEKAGKIRKKLKI